MKNLFRTVMVSALSAALLLGCAGTQLTSKSPEEHFKDAEQSFKKGHYEKAVEEWKKVKESYESPEISAKAEIGIGDAYFLNKDYIEAAVAYEDFRKLHPKHELAGYALFRQGLSYYSQINRIETDQTPVKNALAIFESYTKLYPGGEYTSSEVQDKIRDCKEKQLQYEIYVGRFYLKKENYPAAIARFEEAFRNFPGAQGRDEVLYDLGRAALDGGQKEKGREALDRLLREYPESRFAADARKLVAK
jgi:outer membrane protein assembly factor BamD